MWPFAQALTHFQISTHRRWAFLFWRAILIILPFNAFLLFCKALSLYPDIQIVHLLYSTDRDDSGVDVQ